MDAGVAPLSRVTKRLAILLREKEIMKKGKFFICSPKKFLKKEKNMLFIWHSQKYLYICKSKEISISSL